MLRTTRAASAVFAVCAIAGSVLLTVRPAAVEAVPSQGKKPTPPADQTYVGVRECASCHFKEFVAWRETGHARAFEKLTEKYETTPKCLACHTTGYGKPTGYKDAPSDDLKGITCETCHGPGSKHVEICKAFGDKKLTKEEEDQAEHSIWEMLPVNVCVKCHTIQAHKGTRTPPELQREHQHEQ